MRQDESGNLVSGSAWLLPFSAFIGEVRVVLAELPGLSHDDGGVGSANVDVTVVMSAIEILKTPDSATVEAGADVTFTIFVDIIGRDL